MQALIEVIYVLAYFEDGTTAIIRALDLTLRAFHRLQMSNDLLHPRCFQHLTACHWAALEFDCGLEFLFEPVQLYEFWFFRPAMRTGLALLQPLHYLFFTVELLALIAFKGILHKAMAELAPKASS